MALLTYILLLYFLNYTLADECVLNNVPDYYKWEKELLKDLECDYSAYHPPSENTIVNVTYFINYFSFDSDKKLITLHSWMHSKWKDERLKWDPEKYHGINETDVSKFNIWTPIFGLSNDDVDFFDIEMHASYHYSLNSTGDVHCRHQMAQQAFCNASPLTNWPYDVQECSLQFAPSKYSVGTENLTLVFDFIVMEHYGAEWYLYHYRQVKDHSSKNQVKLTLLLVREAAGLSAIVISPAFVLTVLSILSLYLDVRRYLRLAIISFSLFGHYFFLSELQSNMPKQSTFPPSLLFYYRDSVVLSITIILSTFFLAAICKLKSTPHSYIKQINDFMYENNYRKYLVFPRWDFDDATVEGKPFIEDWLKFANIVNSAFIFLIVFTYIILYGTKVPKPSHLNDERSGVRMNFDFE